MNLNGPLKFLVTVVMLAGIAWVISSVAGDPESDTVRTEQMAPAGETVPDGRGGFYIANWDVSEFWYVRGDRYQPVTGLEGDWILRFVRTSAGDIYAVGEQAIWRLEGSEARAVERGSLPAADHLEDYALPLPDEQDDEPSILRSRPLLPPDPSEDPI